MEGPKDLKLKLPYSPQIDGLRGISVLAVIFFHLRLWWADGGYLGVEAFFVISGFLITSLLLHEFAYTRRINFKQFWLRRARRLLPILFVVLGATILLSLVLARDYLGELRADTAAALGYVTNWHLIWDSQSYFEAIERQSPLLHLWSLAIEEQFYLLWPLVLGLLLKKRSFKLAVGVTIVLIIGSQALSAWYFDDAGLDRAYFGTDSRLSGLLIGALAAIFIPLHEIERYKSALSPKVKKLVGLASWPLLAGVLACMAWVGPASSWPYQGGFLIFGALTVSLLLGVVFNNSSLPSRFIGGPILVWLGTRSYGLYLWHWVIFQFTRPGTDIAIIGWRNTLLRLALTLVATELAYRLVETTLRRPEQFKKLPRLSIAYGLAAATLGVSLIFAAKPSLVAVQWPTKEAVALERQRLGQLGGVPQAQIVNTKPNRQPQEQPLPASQPMRPDGLITIVGDSVVLGAAKSISASVGSPLVLDAKVSRFPPSVAGELKKLNKEGKLGDTVVIAVGANGPIDKSVIEPIMAYLGGRSVIWLTPRGERTWIRDSIAALREYIPKYSNARLADWAKQSAAQPKWFVSDGIHVSEAGAEALAKLVAESVKQ